MRDLHNNLSVVRVLDPDTVTADKAGDTDVDLQGFAGCEIVAVVGASGDTLSGSVKISLELEESDDDSTYTDVPDGDMLDATGAGSGQFALIDDPAEDDAVYRVGYIGDKRYVRIIVNVTGTHTNGTPIGAIAIKGHARNRGAKVV